MIVRARVGGVKGPRAGGTGAGGPFLALKQSNRMGDKARETSLAPHLIGPLGFQRKERGKWGGQVLREKRAESRP